MFNLILLTFLIFQILSFLGTETDIIIETVLELDKNQMITLNLLGDYQSKNDIIAFTKTGDSVEIKAVCSNTNKCTSGFDASTPNSDNKIMIFNIDGTKYDIETFYGEFCYLF